MARAQKSWHTSSRFVVAVDGLPRVTAAYIQSETTFGGVPHHFLLGGINGMLHVHSLTGRLILEHETEGASPITVITEKRHRCALIRQSTHSSLSMRSCVTHHCARPQLILPGTTYGDQQHVRVLFFCMKQSIALSLTVTRGYAALTQRMLSLGTRTAVCGGTYLSTACIRNLFRTPQFGKFRTTRSAQMQQAARLRMPPSSCSALGACTSSTRS